MSIRDIPPPCKTFFCKFGWFITWRTDKNSKVVKLKKIHFENSQLFFPNEPFPYSIFIVKSNHRCGLCYPQRNKNKNEKNLHLSFRFLLSNMWLILVSSVTDNDRVPTNTMHCATTLQVNISIHRISSHNETRLGWISLVCNKSIFVFLTVQRNVSANQWFTISWLISLTKS